MSIAKLLDEACDRMIAMRETEGSALIDELIRHIDAIQQRLDRVVERAPQVVDEYHTRLRTRVAELIQRAQLSLNELDLAREVAIYAERCDVAEEAQRLRAHLTQFSEMIGMEKSEPIGRTLDFLAQEMLREANTIGSKSNDTIISRMIVEIKGAIDRIKEQVQNVE